MWERAAVAHLQKHVVSAEQASLQLSPNGPPPPAVQPDLEAVVSLALKACAHVDNKLVQAEHDKMHAIVTWATWVS